MFRSIIPFVVAGLNVLCSVPTVVAAEQTAGSEATQGDENWNTIKSYSQDKKSEAVAYGKKLMQETDAKIEQLDAKASQVSGEAKLQYEKEMRELKVMRANTAAKLDKMAKESGAAWNDTKQGFADAYKELQHAYRKAVKRFN